MNDQVRAQEDEYFYAKLDRRKAESRARIEAMNAQEEARASQHKSTMQELEELRRASSRSAVVPTDPNAEIYPQADVQLPEDELTDYPKGVRFYEGREGRLDPRQNISVEEGRYDLSGLPLWKQRALRGRVGEQVDYSSVQPLSNPMGGPELTVEEGIERAGDAQQDFSILSHSLNTSGNPDQYARDVELGEKEGVHPFVISQDRETYEQRDNMRMMSKYLTDAPKTKQAMTSPQFYEVAYDSVENLSLIEQTFNKFGRLGGSTIGEAVRSTGSGVRGVGELYESNIVMPLQRALYQIPGFQEVNEAISEAAPIPYWLTPSGYAKTLGGTVADIGEDIIPEDQTLDEKIAGAVGQIASAVGLSLTPAGPSAPIGMFAGMGADQQAQQMRELGLDPNQMPAQVATGAIITGLSEQLRLGSILKLLPQSVRSKAMGNVFARITGQAGEEAIQEAAENIAHNALSMTYDENAELLEGAAEGAVVGGSASAIFQTLVEVILPGKQRMTAARDAAEVAKEMRKEIEAAPFFERAPEKAKEFLDGVTEDQEVYINPDDFLKLYQEDTETYYKILEEVGVSREEVEEAVMSGSDIAVKGSAILTVSDSEQFNALVDVMRTDPDAMSTYEVRESLRGKELEFDHERMLELYEQDDSDADTYTRVSNAVQEAVVDAGRSPQEAEAAGSIWGARFKRLEDDGVDAQKVFEKLGLEVRSVDEQGQPIQKTIRDFWTGPKPKEPQSLNKWIASQGGISEAGMGRGDVMQAIGQKKSSARGVFNENGTPLDMMARRAAEAGYDVDPEDVQSLLDAISNDAQGGTPLYRAGEADEWNAYQEALDQVEEANTDRRGDVKKLTQAQEQGYEGEDIGEATEWTEAIAKGLDMSQEARMQRAKDMGFDTDVVMYRGGRPYDEGVKRPIRWFSDDASIASDYAQEDKQAVSAFYINKGKQLVLDVQGDDWSEISVDKIGASDAELMNYLKDNYGDKITTDELADEIEQSWDDEYDSIMFKDIYDGSMDAPQGNVLAVIWPDARAKIRSVNAAFDPDYADSPNILRQSVGDIDFTTPQARKEWVEKNTISEHIGGKGKDAKRYGFQVNGSTSRVVVQLDPQWEEGAQVLTINQADLKRGRVGGELDLDADGLEGLAENLSAILSQNLDFPVTVEVGNKAEQDFFLEVFKQVAEDNGGRATKAKGLGVYYTGPKSSKKVTKADASPVGEKSVDDETKFFNKLNKFTTAGYGRAEARGGDGASEAARRTLQAQEEQAEREAKLRSERSYPFPRSGLYQKDGKQARGFVEIPKGGVLSDPAVVVSLTKSKNLENAANASTFIHETAHIFLELEMSLESESPAIKARMDAVREWLGIKEGERPTVAQHEKFAESFEAYLLEGKAPNAELRGVFRKFRTWLLDIYVELRGKRKLRNLEPKAREIFDGMLATQVEIEQAQRDFMGPLASAMRDVMSPEQIEKYKKYALEAGELAKDKLFAKYLDGIKKREGRERRQQRKDLTADVTEKLMELPVFKAQDAMAGATGRKLNTSDVVEMRGGDNAAKTKDYHVEGGEHPELVAPDYGFLSGDEMLQALEEAPTLKAAVKSEVDRMMKELHGDMLTDGTMEAEAVEAVFNDKAVKAMEVERNVMAEKAAGDPIPLNDIKAYAEYLITKKPIKEILTPAKYAMQGRNLHKKAVMLAAKGKWDEALNTAHKAMLQHELARRAYKAREEFEKHDRFLKRFSPRKMGKDAHKKFAPEYVEQINRYYALPGAENQQDEFAILNEFALQQVGEGNAVLLNNDIIANQPLPEIRDMTMEQLRDYRDGMQNLNHLGRKNHATKKEAFLDEASSLGEQVTDAAAGKKKVVTPKNPKWKDKLAAKARAFDSVIIRWPFLVEALQGGLKGDVVNALDTPVRKALSLRNSRRMTETKKFAAILKEHGITQSEMSKRVSVPELDAAGPLRFEALLALAQHMGTEQNRDRISSDPSISGDYEQILAILDRHFEKRHWDATQEIWNLIDSMRDESFAVHRRETGVLPKAVSASSFTTKYGTYKGGYSPIKYDMNHATNEDLRKKEIKDIWEQQVAGVSVSAQTKKGFLQERQENVSRPLRMDLTTVLSHIDDVTNDIYMREPINQVWKLVQNSDFRRAVRSAHGKEYLEAMETIIQRTVAGPIQPDKNDVLPNLMRTARVNFSTYLLGFNLVTAGLAPVSYLQTVIPKYGSKIVIRGMSEYYGRGESGLLNSNEFIKEKSTFMRERVDTLNREAHDMLKRNKLDSTYGKFQGLGYVPMTYVELATVSGPVWLGVYHTRLDEGYSEADAITEADRAVATTQGSGLEIDQSVMQSGNELQKWMTWMYGYVSGVYGVVRNDVAAHDKVMSKLFPIVKHLIIYNVLASTAEALLRHGISDDEEDPFYQSVIDLMIRNSIGLVPGVSGLLSKYSNETALDDTADKVREAVGDYFAVGQEFMEDGRIEGETIGNALGTTIEAAAMATGVPGGAQVKKIAKTLSEDDDPTLYEALVTGPDDDN